MSPCLPVSASFRASASSSALARENAELKLRLQEAEETLRAIHEGEVDAVIVSGTRGDQIFSLVGTDSIYRLIVETMKEAAFTVTLEGKILFCNSQFGAFVKRPLELVVGHQLQEFVAEADRAATSALLATAQQKSVRQRLVFETLECKHVPAHVSANILNQPDSVSICIVATDLTELENSTHLIQQLRRQQEAMRESEARFRAAFEDAAIPTAMAGMDRRFIRANEAFCQMLGRTQAELTGRDYAEFTHPEDLGQNLDGSTKLASGQTGSFRMEKRYIRKDGSIVWGDMSTAIVRDAQGTPQYTVTHVQDISDRKRVELALRETLERFYLMLSNMYCGVLLMTEEGRVEFLNQAFCMFYGLEVPPGDLVGLTSRELLERVTKSLLHPEQAAARIREILQRGQPVRGEEFAMRDGHAALRDFIPLRVKGTPCGRLWLHVDITERKQAEDALRQSEERYRLLFQSLQEGFYLAEVIFDHRGVCCDARYLDVNPAFEQIMGLPRDQIIGRRATELVNGLKPEWLEVFGRVAATGEPVIHQAYSEVFRKHFEAFVFRPAPGQFGVLVTDISQRKQAEEALLKTAEELTRSNKDLEAFAHVASHDLQEPLRMVSSFMGLLQDRYRGQLDERAQQYIGFAVDGANRMSLLVKDLLAYARAGARKMQAAPVDMAGVAAEAQENLRAAIEEADACIRVDPLPTLMADATHMLQLFQNLIGNAVKFRDKARRVEIHVGARLSAGEWILHVQDNGIGIDPEQAGRLFTIFERLHTRDEYPGTGIGLATCKRIVERHNGRIWIESEPGKGSTFFFTLPA